MPDRKIIATVDLNFSYKKGKEYTVGEKLAEQLVSLNRAKYADEEEKPEPEKKEEPKEEPKTKRTRGKKSD